MADEQISEAMSEIAALAERLGIARINEREGCWEHRIDDHWSISCNGHQETTKNSQGVEVPPFSVYVEWCGWPAGIINPYGGAIAAGAAANEAAFVDALRKCGT